MSEAAHETREERIPEFPADGLESKRDPLQGLTKAIPKPRREQASTLQRTASALRTAVPLVQKLLPLLDGNVASAVANLVAPRLLGPPTVDLSPIETSLMKLRGDLAVVQDKNAQHDVAFKRIDDQLETMKDVVERTAAEQRDVAANLSRVRRNVLVFWLVGIALMVVSIGLNVALFFFVKGNLR